MSRILIVDDHPVVCMAVRSLLEQLGHEIVAETDNGVDAVQLVRDLNPDMIVLDIGIPRLNGMEVIARLEALDPPSRILVLTSQSAQHFANRCMEAGAAGFISKQKDLAELQNATIAILGGYRYFPDLAFQGKRKRGLQMSEDDLIGKLSDRELDVLQQLVSGIPSKEIAVSMLISPKTVSTYKARLQEKLNAQSLVELIDIARRNGLV
ncbi:response regulator transcription factor [Collimonas sp. H4R21]|uniref:Response regulator transcription factor n=1 Tax=Collimonas rhizosphaerae TaxID=3126357 RepID=A0ABU9Q3C4_9BURK